MKGSTDREMERGTVAKHKLNKLNSGATTASTPVNRASCIQLILQAKWEDGKRGVKEREGGKVGGGGGGHNLDNHCGYIFTSKGSLRPHQTCGEAIRHDNYPSRQ